MFSSLRTRGQKVSSDRAQPPPKIQAAKRAAFIFGERSRKASLHAFGNLPHKRQLQKLFTSSRGDSRSSLKLRQRLACEDVSFRLRSITLVKRSACAAREVFSLARVRIVFQSHFLFLQKRLSMPHRMAVQQSFLFSYSYLRIGSYCFM